MKKTVIILIAVIYVASIAIVTYFGLKHQTYHTIIPVADVEIVNEGIKYTSDNKKYIVLNTADNPDRTFQLECVVTPSDADNPVLSYLVSDTRTATVDENGLVTFITDDPFVSVIVYVESTDGTRIGDSIEVTFLTFD